MSVFVCPNSTLAASLPRITQSPIPYRANPVYRIIDTPSGISLFCLARHVFMIHQGLLYRFQFIWAKIPYGPTMVRRVKKWQALLIFVMSGFSLPLLLNLMFSFAQRRYLSRNSPIVIIRVGLRICPMASYGFLKERTFCGCWVIVRHDNYVFRLYGARP